MRYFLLLSLVGWNIFASEQYDQFIIDYPSYEYELSANQKNNLEFIRDLKLMHVPTRYLEEGFKSITGIVFKKMPDNAVAYYNKLNKKIYFAFDMQDPLNKQLKRVKDLTLDHLATVVHEVWHAYFYNVAQRRENIIYKNWFKGAKYIYPDHGLKYHDEAYGLYVEKVLQMYVLIRRTFENKTPEIRESLRQSKPLKSMYEGVFNEKGFGYYVNFRREAIYTNVNLSELDRVNILQNLFDNLLKKGYQEVYAENRF